MKAENHLLVIMYPLLSIRYQLAQCVGEANGQGRSSLKSQDAI